MREYEFYQLDVFTDNRFDGNPLAVFPEASGISEDDMQKIAAEMNLSETVFVLASEKALKRLRIFTPKRELPIAGHPVVGTWNLLARLGIASKTGSGVVRVEQELNLGVLPVEIEFENGIVTMVTMTQGGFSGGHTISDSNEISLIAKGLGLDPADLAQTEELPIQVVSTGIKALDVPLTSLRSMKKIKINPAVLSDIYLKYGAVGVYAFTFETIEPGSDVHARFFAPADGIPEDPATGSAAGSFAGYAVYHGAINRNRITIEQGDFMNRPSRIFAYVTGEKGDIQKVQISGRSVIVATGKFYLEQ